MVMYKKCFLFVSFLFCILLLTGCYKPDYDYKEVNPGQLQPPSVDLKSEDYRKTYGELTRYDETVKIDVAVCQFDLESGVKVGTTPENQSFNKIAKDVLNIELNYVVVGSSSSYDNKLNLYISSGKMPDMFYTTSTSLYSQLYNDEQLADLSNVFWYLNDDLQDNYLSYFKEILPTCMDDSKLYALPAITNTYASAQRLYIRQDWLDIIGKEAPTTIDEMMEVGQLFIDKKDDIAKATGINSNRVIPFTFNKEITWSGSYSAEGFFNCFGTSINSYFPDENNELYYSNVSDNTKNALGTLNNMYKKGILDQEFLSKSAEQIQANIKAGYVGMVFGEWWMAKDVLDDCISNVDGSNWTWVDLPAYGENESAPIVNTVSVSGYNLVSKNCKNPEAVAKLINLFYDIYYSDDAIEKYGSDVLPSNGFYYQFVPVKLWDGASSLREYYRVQDVFTKLYEEEFDPSKIINSTDYANNAMVQRVTSVVESDYVVSTSSNGYDIINRDIIESIKANERWLELFDTLRNREKILHFVSGYPYYVALKKGKSIDNMTSVEKSGWGIYHEMIDPKGGYAYVVNLTEGKEKAKYDCFYGANLSAMNEYIEYINTQTNVVFTKIITGQIPIENFDDEYVQKIFNNNGGDVIINQVNQWYKAHNVDYDSIYALIDR